MSDIVDDCGGHSTPSPGGSIAGDVSDGVVEAVADEAPSFSPRGLSLFLIEGGSTLWDNRSFRKLLEPQEVAANDTPDTPRGPQNLLKWARIGAAEGPKCEAACAKHRR